MAGAADVDGRRTLRIGLRAVDVGPGRSVQDERSRELRRRRQCDVPVGVRERDDVLVGEGLLECAPELPGRARDQDSAASRSDRIGDLVLQR